MIVCSVKFVSKILNEIPTFICKFDPNLGFSGLGICIIEFAYKGIWIAPLAPGFSNISTD